MARQVFIGEPVALRPRSPASELHRLEQERERTRRDIALLMMALPRLDSEILRLRTSLTPNEAEAYDLLVKVFPIGAA